MKQLPAGAKAYVYATTIAAVYILAVLCRWHLEHPSLFFLYLCAGSLASALRVSLPGITGTMSVNFVFALMGVGELNLVEAIAVSCPGIIGQFLLRSRLWQPVQVLFNLSSTVVTTTAAYLVYHSTALRSMNSSVPILLMLTSAALFLANTLSISAIISLSEKKSLWRVWRNGYFWTGSHFLVGAGIAAVFQAENKYFGWESTALTIPVIYLLYRSYSLHLGTLQKAKLHASEIGDLHWRAIEALALAIDAKDETTHNHLLRVRIYAAEIGKELKLEENEMRALEAASLLHDIGKLAVPEHIISKPGKLTSEEFEKMKVHPVVGAEILERVRFPYPVVPIVRSHHEKWNGEGYPDGLKGEQIPIGARILAAVDCLDALASDRQYRRAMPIQKAMQIVISESGRSFDPRVVEVLERRYLELEDLARAAPPPGERALSTGVKFERGFAPAAGFERTDSHFAPNAHIDFLVAISAARQEFQSLFKLTEELGNALSVDETLSLAAARLKRSVPHDTIAIYLSENQKLVPRFVSGEESRLFSSLAIPIGQGLSGWVVQNQTPIINGNPSVEPAYLGDASIATHLRSAISVPLGTKGEAYGALSLYSAIPDFFTKDHLRILLAICEKAGPALTKAIQHRSVVTSAANDDLTGLPNSRALFVYLERELDRVSNENSSLAVIFVDLDGFRKINEAFGELEGNRILQRVAEGLRNACRSQDFISRLGGDKFVLVISGMPADYVERKLAQIDEAVSRTVNAPKRLSASIGMALYPADGLEAEALIEIADRRMYENKNGRSGAIAAMFDARQSALRVS
jgi:diguanylate cyclase (GGDEF)-like protein/putative nucleotidyltransferase with HDIG domain